MSETIIQTVRNLYRHVRRHTSQKPLHFEMSQTSFDKLWSERWAKSPEARCPCKRDVFASLGCLACDDTGVLPEQPLPEGETLYMYDLPILVVPDEQLENQGAVRIRFAYPAVASPPSPG